MIDEMIIKGDWSNFLNLEKEELLLVKRRHYYVLIFPIFLSIFVLSIFNVALFVVFVRMMNSFPLFIVTLLLSISILISLISYTIVNWYFHLYILTNRKILEVWYTPLSAHAINDIFLDSVKCTEVDTNSTGFIHELMDMGDLRLTFDRPTHQEEFLLKDIKNYDEIGKFLTQKLMDGNKRPAGDTVWIRTRSRFLPKPVI
ncbi:MAG TPA: hypothetical protein VLG67_03000 [Candidatus Saccharimonadales bacterium]|nr:hypothetical protein [Candidatus Saccharimonadales bacterium]